MQASTDEVRARVDEIVQRLNDDRELQAEMKRSPVEALVRAGLGEEAAVILADDWVGAMSRRPGQGDRACEVNNSCRFTDSDDPCGPTVTTLRGCG